MIHEHKSDDRATPFSLLPASTPSPYAEKTYCETVRLATPQTSIKSTGYAHRAATSQKHRICETVSVLELMSNESSADRLFTVSQFCF